VTAESRQRRLVIVWIVLGLALAIVPAFLSSFMLCGISGCTGGGFGRATDPGATLFLLLATGIVAASPLALYAIAKRNPKLLAGAAALAIAVTLTTGAIIGSDFRGCPRNVDQETCLDEASPG
jgi:hypothetical protein